MNALPQAPFRIEGVVEPPYFTDRAEEVARVRRALEHPPSRLLVYGERRMGKTSALQVARMGVERAGGAVVFADLSTVSSPADMANRVLEAATRSLGRRWGDFLGDLTGRLRVRLQLVPDPATGLAVPTVEAELRSREVGEQYDTFVSVLEALERMAEGRDTGLGVVLDEFQEIHRFGGEDAEWRLRGVIQHHQRLSYVLAGSDASLIRAMLGRGRAFYELFDPLHFGPMDPGHLSRWIDERLEGAGVSCPGAGERSVRVAGPRTRDVVRVARPQPRPTMHMVADTASDAGMSMYERNVMRLALTTSTMSDASSGRSVRSFPTVSRVRRAMVKAPRRRVLTSPVWTNSERKSVE